MANKYINEDGEIKPCYMFKDRTVCIGFTSGMCGECSYDEDSKATP